MKILFDQGTPAPLRRALVGHAVETAHERGWSVLENGDLLSSAERAGFDVFITTDANLVHQQNLSIRTISIVVLSTTSWPRIQRSLARIRAVVGSATPGRTIEIQID